ncbi:probable leucine-rich repeat receptor kinase At5g49770 [Olea europaea subsp. europaea]|uniref:non-specific serine/threonine protein kinase n=1 Tax=Olea europaea subsp. europaea TaxID=158383 RepID=A0A8S0Q2I6_OLEEU|nr:probable leucine-rich repeat receptor kinase At5g49770 [Olea europaea subsp. europaea]
MVPFQLLFCSLFLFTWINAISSATNPEDAAVLQSLKDQWGNTPPSWNNSNDPCGTWDGITCDKNASVVELELPGMGLTGILIGDIAGLTELNTLDLSFNRGLTGPLSPRLGDLPKLNTLNLAGCSFTGIIPSELGNLTELTYLALNSNNFTGEIPSSLGKLSNIYWLDLAENHLTGTLPVSTGIDPGLDSLKKAKHFHFNKNQLSGEIPAKLFSSDMSLIDVLFDQNLLEGSIPYTLGLVQTLEVLRLNQNAMTGSVPSNLNDLTNVHELNLAHNMLTGKLPNLTGMNSLSYVDLSNNSFQKTEAPGWISTLDSLTTLIIEYGPLQGLLPPQLFSLPQIQQVKLRNNAFSGQLDMSRNISLQLQLTDLQDNDILSVTLSSENNTTLLLAGNPACDAALKNTVYCQRR